MKTKSIFSLFIIMSFSTLYSQIDCNSLKNEKEKKVSYVAQDGKKFDWCDMEKPTQYTNCMCKKGKKRKNNEEEKKLKSQQNKNQKIIKNKSTVKSKSDKSSAKLILTVPKPSSTITKKTEKEKIIKPKESIEEILKGKNYILKKSDASYLSGYTYYVFAKIALELTEGYNVIFVKPHKIVTKKSIDLSKIYNDEHQRGGVTDCGYEVGDDDYDGYPCITANELFFKGDNSILNSGLYSFRKYANENSQISKYSGVFIFKNEQDAIDTYEKYFKHMSVPREYGPKNVSSIDFKFQSGY